jgi:hypothetical protein
MHQLQEDYHRYLLLDLLLSHQDIYHQSYQKPLMLDHEPLLQLLGLLPQMLRLL